MLSLNFPLPVKFICGFIYRQEEIYQKAKKILQNKFGSIDFENQKLAFTFTQYYDKEMGSPLFKRIISFTRLRDAAEFIKIKLFCIKVERKFLSNKNRQVNIDPGYLNDAKLVLLTTKDYAHRLYLGKGVFAEVTLRYSDGAFYDLAHTYPDFRSPQYKEILLSIRQRYHEQIKKLPSKTSPSH
jgi:hypothetical protein